MRSKGCPWDNKICAKAAQGGHLDILKYLHENGCPWDNKTCENAMQYNHMDVLEYAVLNGCLFDMDELTWRAHLNPRIGKLIDTYLGNQKNKI